MRGRAHTDVLFMTLKAISIFNLADARSFRMRFFLNCLQDCCIAKTEAAAVVQVTVLSALTRSVDVFCADYHDSLSDSCSKVHAVALGSVCSIFRHE